jgi:eukaryotic-like serine/threonine-protein kinase
MMMNGELVAGRYRLVEPIGEGATGTVYRAVDEGGEPGEAVAVKVLRHGAGGKAAEASRRFEREAVAVGKLDHPNLVAIRDFGALDDGRPYLVMDLVEGPSLAALLADEGSLPPERALSILSHVLRGLAEAHRQGVVHRDLKPADILLVDRGGDPDTAVIVDFGTAALVGAAGATAEQLTSAGAALGTPAYMAPERLDPAHGPVDGRAVEDGGRLVRIR